MTTHIFLLLASISFAPVAAASWNFSCTGEGQTINGAPYTKVRGELRIDFRKNEAGISVQEFTLPPFTPAAWELGEKQMPITQLTEERAPGNTDALNLTLKMNRPNNGAMFNRYYELEATLPLNYKSMPAPQETRFSVTYVYQIDQGERGPMIETETRSFSLQCFSHPNNE